MARKYTGSKTIPFNYKINGSIPIDDRWVVQSSGDVIGANSVYATDSVYEGMEVQVVDGSKYRFTGKHKTSGKLTNSDVQSSDNWLNLDKGENLSGVTINRFVLTDNTSTTLQEWVTNVTSKISSLEGATSGMIDFVGTVASSGAITTNFTTNNPNYDAVENPTAPETIGRPSGSYVVASQPFNIKIKANPADTSKDKLIMIEAGDEILLLDTFNETEFFKGDGNGMPTKFTIIQSNLTGALTTDTTAATTADSIAVFTGSGQKVSGVTKDSLVVSGSNTTGFVTVGSATTDTTSLKPVIFDSNSGIPYYKETDAPNVLNLTGTAVNGTTNGLMKVKYISDIDEITI